LCANSVQTVCYTIKRTTLDLTVERIELGCACECVRCCDSTSIIHL